HRRSIATLSARSASPEYDPPGPATEKGGSTMRVFRSIAVILPTSIVLLAAVTLAAARTSGVTGSSCGPAWGIVSSANNSAWDTNTLRGVSAQSDDDALAAGFSADNTSGDTATLAEHWNGSKWHRVSADSPGNFSSLSDVHFVGANDAWAV